MNFNEQYLTYAEYRQLGGNLDEMPFNVLELRARKKVDERTFGRLKNLTSQITEVKTCIYQLIESMQIHEKQKSKNISSENTDGYSISYITADRISEVVKSKSIELDDIIRTYLLGVIYNGEHLMYAGVK